MHFPSQFDVGFIPFLPSNPVRRLGIGLGIVFACFLSVVQANDRLAAFNDQASSPELKATVFDLEPLRHFEQTQFGDNRGTSSPEFPQIQSRQRFFKLRHRTMSPFERDVSGDAMVVRAQSPDSALQLYDTPTNAPLQPSPVHGHDPKFGLGGRGWTSEALEAPGFRQSPPTPATLNLNFDGALAPSVDGPSMGGMPCPCPCPAPCGPVCPGGCSPTYWDECWTDPYRLSFCNDVRGLPQRWKSDLSALLTCENVLFLGAAAGITVVVRDNIDERVSHDLQTNGPRWGQFSNVMSHAGDPLVIHAPILAAMYLTSLYEQDEDLHELTLTMFTSYKFAILSSVALQYMTHTHESHGGVFNLLGDSGFPSEPTTGSFALAAVIDERFGWRCGLPAYLISGLIGYSEIDQQRHTVSDVVFGAALGYVIGKSIGAQRYRPDSPYRLVPFSDAVSGTQGMGFQVVY